MDCRKWRGEERIVVKDVMGKSQMSGMYIFFSHKGDIVAGLCRARDANVSLSPSVSVSAACAFYKDTCMEHASSRIPSYLLAESVCYDKQTHLY